MRLIDADALKKYYSWLNEESQLKKRDFDAIVDMQPEAHIEMVDSEIRICMRHKEK